MKNTVLRQEVIDILNAMDLTVDPVLGTAENVCEHLGADSKDVSFLVHEAELNFGISLGDVVLPDDFSVEFFVEICQEKINDKIMEKYLDSIKVQHV